MILDAHTPCPACPQVVRDFYVVSRRLLSVTAYATAAGEADVVSDEFLAALDALKLWIEAHHANQVHAFSVELEDARNPQLSAVAVDHDGSPR